MTNNPGTPSKNSNQGNEVQKESVISKVAGGLSWWINAMMGKPLPKKKTPPPAKPSEPSAQSVGPEQKAQIPSAPATMPSRGESGVSAQAAAPEIANKEEIVLPSKQAQGGDSVVQDLEGLKKIVGKFSKNIGTAVSPSLEKGLKSSTKAAGNFAKAADKSKLFKNVLRIFLILIFLMVAAFVAMRLFRTYQEDTPQDEPTITGIETPTPIVFQPAESVYANDPVILKLQEDIEVMVREIAGTNIKVTTLNPPSLDFNVSF